MNGEIKEGHIYELPFDGSDAHAEVIERTTGLTFLGDSTDEYPEERPCHMSGQPTKRRVLLLRPIDSLSVLKSIRVVGQVHLAHCELIQAVGDFWLFHEQLLDIYRRKI